MPGEDLKCSIDGLDIGPPIFPAINGVPGAPEMVDVVISERGTARLASTLYQERVNKSNFKLLKDVTYLASINKVGLSCQD